MQKVLRIYEYYDGKKKSTERRCYKTEVEENDFIYVMPKN